jgi:transmembrane sensor
MSAGESETDLNAIDLEALRWVILMEDGPLPTEQQRELDSWLSKDARHQGALIRAQAASLRLNRLSALSGGRSLFESPPQRNTTRRQLLAAAAAGTGLLGFMAWRNREWLQELWPGTLYSSDIGQTRKIVLPDGSLMTLNTQSEVRAHYTRNAREIRLTKGEVLFNVAHDATRNFVVRIGSWTVFAVGTAFNIRRLTATSMDVTVTEGIVEMLPSDSAPTQKRQQLTALHEARTDDDGRLEVRELSDTELQRRLAWRSGLIVFDGETLRQALAEINRYGTRRIMVADPELAESRIVGVFPTSDTQTFVHGMHTTLGVEAVETGKGVLLRLPE